VKKPHLAIFLGSSWAIKNLVLTSTLARLRNSFRLTVWVIPSFFPGTVRLAKSLGLTDIKWLEIPAFVPGAGHQFACRVQKGIMYDRHRVSTEQIASKSLRGKRSRMNRLSGKILRAAIRTPLVGPLEKFTCRLRRTTSDTTFIAQAFEADCPDLVLLTNAVDRQDDPIYYEALRREIPQLNLVHSWDNLTSKGIIHPGLAKILVWNRVTKNEILKMYDSYRADQVVEVGISRFDVYREAFPAAFERIPFMTRLGLDPDKRMMIYANTSTLSFPTQPEVLDHIVKAMHDGSLPPDLQLLIRLHPHDLPFEYQRFREPGVVAIWPTEDAPEAIQQSALVPPADDLWTLAASLRHSELCINAASTMALDAAACDRPVISIAYDGETQLNYFDSIKSAYDYEHQKPFLKLEAIDLVHNREQLIAAICGNLLDPGSRAEQRRAVRELFLGGDVSAVTRFEKAVLSALAT
jgi:hypothetical protein